MASSVVTLRWGDVGRAAVEVVATALGLLLAGWLLPGLVIRGLGQALLIAVVFGLVGLVLRPVLVRVAARLGWVGAIALAIFGHAILVYVAIAVVVDSDDRSFFAAFVASCFVAVTATLAVWVVTAGSNDAVTASLIRRSHRYREEVADPDVPGVVFVQFDGLPFPVLRTAVLSGTLPTLSRWIRDGTHRMAEWQPMLPATTPASQMGILHGTIEGIPAFRWVERETARVLVANRPRDAAEIEATHSDGHGLLADDGVSVGNLFTGDSTAAYATMSAIGRSQETRETRTAVSRFLIRPDGLARGLSRTMSEVVRERFQARRAVRRDVRPRVHRGWGFAVERAGLNGVLRDLNTSLVADAMLRGKRSVYVNYVDYDAIAHHAGVLRPESLAALEGIDATIAELAQIAEVAPRKYHIVVLSDHGQSQGAIFAERFGEDLATLVGRLADADVVAAMSDPETAGRLNAMLAGGAGDDTVIGKALTRASVSVSADTDAETAAAQAAHTAEAADRSDQADDKDRFIVFGSGNLGLVFVAGQDHRLTLDELEQRFPVLVPGLAAHPGVSFVVVDTVEHGPVAIGARGAHRLGTGVVVGEDPLVPFGDHAAEFLLRAARMPEAPDIYVNSLLDEMGEVAAFEGLVGCHGGLGGWQDRAMLVWPAEFAVPDEKIVGAHALHDVLVGWLEHLGHRQDLPPLRERTYDVRRREAEARAAQRLVTDRAAGPLVPGARVPSGQADAGPPASTSASGRVGEADRPNG